MSGPFRVDRRATLSQAPIVAKPTMDYHGARLSAVQTPSSRPASPLDSGDVRAFYDSEIVIDTFNAGFSGRWHTALSSARIAGIEDGTDYVCGLLDIDSSHHVLDFGSGVGPTTCDVAVRRKCRVRGVNIAPKQVMMAQEYSRRLGLDARVAFDLSAGERLPYEDGAFDRVVFFESVCHVPDKPALFSELFRVLKPGGRVGGQDWSLPDRVMTPVDFNRYVRPIEIACAVSLVSLAGYSALFEAAGFRDVGHIDAREVFADIGWPQHYDRTAPIEVSETDDLGTRLRKGNAAIGQAQERGLFTVGFVWATRPPA